MENQQVKRWIGLLMILAGVAALPLYSAVEADFNLFIVHTWFRAAWIFIASASLIFLGIQIQKDDLPSRVAKVGGAKSDLLQSHKEPKPKRVVDGLYFILSLPLLYAVFHELIICEFAPELGFQQGSVCTLGFSVFYFLPIFVVWCLSSVVLLATRVPALFRLKAKDASILIVCYAVCFLVPFLYVLSLFR